MLVLSEQGLGIRPNVISLGFSKLWNEDYFLKDSSHSGLLQKEAKWKILSPVVILILMRIYFTSRVGNKRKYWYHTKLKTTTKLQSVHPLHCHRSNSAIRAKKLNKIWDYIDPACWQKLKGSTGVCVLKMPHNKIKASWLDGLLGCRGFYLSSRSMAV